MHALPIRIRPGEDLRAALAAIPAAHGVEAAFVLQGIGSLQVAMIRLAGASDASELRGDFEILSLGGSLSPDGPHLHIAIADATGHVTGGHLAAGSVVRTTAEVLVALLPAYRFRREPDQQTGYPELVIAPRGQ
jgi:predicted DNA-binding protein with PD1-like motif